MVVLLDSTALQRLDNLTFCFMSKQAHAFRSAYVGADYYVHEFKPTSVSV
jgi:hypothetical protein